MPHRSVLDEYILGWEYLLPKTDGQHLGAKFGMSGWLSQILDTMCYPGIFAYHLVESKSLRAFHVGGAIEHIYGVSDKDVLALSAVDLANKYIFPDDRDAFRQFIDKTFTASRENPSLKRTFFYRLMTDDGRVLQIMHVGHTIPYKEKDPLETQLEVLVDVSHIRPPDARPMMTLLSMKDVGEPSLEVLHYEGVIKRMGPPLSDSQLMILRLLAEGKTSKQIAYMHKISVHTVDTQRRRILNKTGTHNTTEAIALALQQGWL